MQVQVGQAAAGVAEGAEGRRTGHAGNARQLLAQVVGKAAAVVRRMEQAIHVVEDVLAADRLAGVGGAEVGQTRVGDGVPAAQRGAAGPGGRRGFVEEAALGRGGGIFVRRVVEVEGEALPTV